ncbi:unnamed protein product [Chrysoparadoxa australica]
MDENSSTGSQVYVPDKDHGWLKALVISKEEGGTFHVKIQDPDAEDDEEIRKVNLGGPEFAGIPHQVESLPLQNTKLGSEGVADMTALDYLHEPAILYNLRRRFRTGHPYTYTGDIVLAVNPFCWLDLYNDEVQAQYDGMVTGHRNDNGLAPHVYSTSSIAYQSLRCSGINQSVLVSGESGAGKTETVKILLNHLAGLATPGVSGGGGEGGGGGKEIESIIQSNPLLESFGNAKTVRNDNSSRFGKFTQLQFEHDNTSLVGSVCTTYLLEKSRVIGHSEGERSYHIFYQMLAAPKDQRAAWYLGQKTANDFRFLTADGTEADSIIEGKTDAERFALTRNALQLVGLSDTDLQGLFRALAGLLFLGEVDVLEQSQEEAEASRIDIETDTCISCCKALGLSPESLGHALCFRTVRAREETFATPNRREAAIHVRNSMAKALYSCLFDWLVRHINACTRYRPKHASSDEVLGHPNLKQECSWIALLDIFGFESFAVNRFEQLCINYCNEKLQWKFTQDVFSSVQAEYEEEGIPWAHISFSDNSDILSLIEGRLGVIALLNEECTMPKGSDESFVRKLGSLHEDKRNLFLSKLSKATFGIQHYAGRVTYTAAGFVEKNRDAIGEDVVELLLASSEVLVAGAFSFVHGVGPTKVSPRGKKGHRRNNSAMGSMANKFKQNLASLMDNIGRTQVQYVRCIKPNSLKSHVEFDKVKVIEQLRCAGVVEAIRLSRSSYPNRMRLEEFWQGFSLLDTSAADAPSLLQRLLKKEQYEAGTTRVYFVANTLEQLEAMKLEVMTTKAQLLQSVCRMWGVRREFQRTKRAQTLLSARWRGRVARYTFQRERSCALTCQCAWRVYQARHRVQRVQEHRAQARVASGWRMSRQRRAFVKERGACVKVQAFVRMRQATASYVVLAQEAREAAKLENQILALQKRLEEEQQERAQQDEEMRAMRAKLANEAHGPVAKSGALEPPLAMAPAAESTDDSSLRMLKESQDIISALRAETMKLRRDNHALKDERDELRQEKAKAAALQEATNGGSYAALQHSVRRLAGENRALMKALGKLNHQRDLLVEEVHNKDDEGTTLRLLFDAEVLTRKSLQSHMETIIGLIAETPAPING